MHRKADLFVLFFFLFPFFSLLLNVVTSTSTTDPRTIELLNLYYYFSLSLFNVRLKDQSLQDHLRRPYLKIIFPNLDPQGAFLEEREIIGVALVANEVGKYKSKHRSATEDRF